MASKTILFSFVNNFMLSIKLIFSLKNIRLLIIKYNKEYSCNSILLIDFVSFIIFFVEESEATCLIANFFPLLKLGVNWEIFSRKNSNTYFLIYSSFIVLEIFFNFFSKIANEDGEFEDCFLKWLNKKS